MTRFIVGLATVFAIAAALVGSAQSAPSLKGAWKVVEYTGPDGKVDKAPQPGLYVFTERHYSILFVRAPRAPLPEKPTDKDLLAAWDPFTANSGTYEVKGATLATRPLVAKMPSVMTGPGQQFDVKFDGAATVTLTGPGPNGRIAYKLQRVE